MAQGRKVAVVVYVVVASCNPVKAQAAFEAFRMVFPGERIVVQSLRVTSSVRAQPWSDGETLCGAFSRVDAAMSQCAAADFWVGMEAGVEESGEEVGSFGWIVVRSGAQVGKAKTGMFFLPQAVVDLLKQGYELGEADDIVFGSEHSKQGPGAIGLLTGGVVTRMTLYRDAVVAALVPFRNPHLY